MQMHEVVWIKWLNHDRGRRDSLSHEFRAGRGVIFGALEVSCSSILRLALDRVNAGGGCVIAAAIGICEFRYADETDIERDGAGDKIGGEYGGGGVSLVAVDVLP